MSIFLNFERSSIESYDWIIFSVVLFRNKNYSNTSFILGISIQKKLIVKLSTAFDVTTKTE